LSRSPSVLGAPTDDDLAGIIRAGATGLGVDVTPGQTDQLVAYVRLIERWNATYNLTAVRTLEAMATQHVVDSLSIVAPMRRRLPGIENRILDVGTGAGLPGVVLAIVAPEAVVVCVDSVGKKAAFVTHVAAALGVENLAAVHSRVEAMKAPPAFGFIVSRAFSSLSAFVSSTRHLLAPGGWWMAMKGKVPHEKLSEVASSGARFEIEQLSIPGLAAERCLLIGQAISESERKL
jgi:16S rRNA (guanine527-N7)-methyltransferase